MKTANLTLFINRGHSVPKRNVTPAEAALYIAEHHAKVGGNPVKNLEVQKEEVERTPIQERNRLVRIFGKTKVTAMFPGGSPRLPETFDEALEIGLGTEVPETEFVNGSPPPPPEKAEVESGLTGDE